MVSSAFALTFLAHGAPDQAASGFKDNVNGHPDFSPTAAGIHLETNVGSFAIKRGSEAPNNGTLDIDFTGTVLVGGLKGSAVPGPGVKLEYQPAGINRQVYHGKGTLKISGQFVKILFFGRDMHALYNGSGIIEVSGEFDRDLNTGWFWYGSDYKNKQFWMTGVMTVPPVPQRQNQEQPAKVKIKNVTGKG